MQRGRLARQLLALKGPKLSDAKPPRSPVPPRRDRASKGRHPSTDPNHGQDDTGYDIQEEERDLHHQPGPGHVHVHDFYFFLF